MKRISSQSRRSLFAWVCAAAIALPTTGAHAQAASNPNLNAQLLVGARRADIAQVERVLAHGAVPNSRNRMGKTALLLACEKGNLPLAEVMLRNGADISMASIEGVTPLMAASYDGNAELVRRLLAAGARTEPVDRMKKPAIVYAAGRGHAAAVDAPVDRMKKPAIVYAAGRGHAAAVDALLASGIDVNATYEHQLTLLMWAAGQGHADVVKLLLARGARADLRDDRGLSALDIARQTHQAESLALLDPRRTAP